MKIFAIDSFKTENKDEVTAEEYIEVMCENIENGTITIAKYEDELVSCLAANVGEATGIYTFTIDIAKVNVEEIIKEEEALYADLAEIAKHNGSKIESAAQAKAILGERLADVWAKYIRAFEYAGEDKEEVEELVEDENAIAFGEIEREFSAEEEAKLANYYAGIRAEYTARVGGICAAKLVCCAQRLVRMLELGAPDMIILNEKRDFAEVFTLNIFATDFKSQSVEDWKNNAAN